MTNKIVDEEELKKAAGGSSQGPFIAMAVINAIKGGVSKDEILATIDRYRGEFTQINIQRITEEFMNRFGEDPFNRE